MRRVIQGQAGGARRLRVVLGEHDELLIGIGMAQRRKEEEPECALGLQ